MRTLLTLSLVLLGVCPASAEEKTTPPATAPAIVLKSPDGKQSVDLAKLVNEGPVLVRLTCACTGCDQELPFFKKLQEAYQAKGLQTVAVFRESPEKASDYAVKKDVKFLWLSDPKGELWKTFDSKAMPTNILIEKGGKVISVVPGCKVDGKNAQAISATLAKMLKVQEVQIMTPTKK